MNYNTNILDVIFRTGLIILISGIMVGLFFGEWTVMLVVGIIFTISPIIGKRLQFNRESLTQDEGISRANKDELTSRQEFPGLFTT